MRDLKRWVGMFALLVALPAWASDMCALGGMLVLPPVYLWVIAACLAALCVRKPTAAYVWGILLLVGAGPAFGAAFSCLHGSFHGEELVHEEMFLASGLAIVALIAAYAWAFWRIVQVPQSPQGTSEGS